MTRVSTLLFWTLLTIAASVGLYNTSYRVHDLAQQLHTINRSIEAEQRNLHVLKAEWVYLTNPAKIEQEARKHLNLQQTSLQQVAKLDKLLDVLPTHAEAMGETMVSHAPMAMPTQATSTQHTQKVASADDRVHVNTRMIIQHSPNASLLPNKGSMVLARLGTKP